MIKKIAITLFAALTLFSCKDDRTQYQIDAEALDEYISNNGIDATQHAGGFYYDILSDGNDNNPSQYSVISVKYKGELTDGTVFDETNGGIIQFQLSGLVQGWQYALPLIGEGGKIKFYLPGYLGYGTSSSEAIPANSILIFTVELVRITG